MIYKIDYILKDFLRFQENPEEDLLFENPYKKLTKNEIKNTLNGLTSPFLSKIHNKWIKLIKSDSKLFSKYKNHKFFIDARNNKKKNKVSSLTEIVFKRDIIQAWWDGLTQTAQKTAIYLTVFGSTRLDILETIIGEKLSEIKDTSIHNKEIFIYPELNFVFTDKAGYYWNVVKSKSVVYIMPTFLEAIQFLNDFYVLPIPADPSSISAEFIFDDEDDTIYGIKRGADFIEKGLVDLKKNGMPSVKGLKDFANITRLREFFPKHQSNNRLKSLRLNMVYDFIQYSFMKKEKNKGLSDPEMLKKRFHLWVESEYALTHTLLPHIKIKDSFLLYNYMNNIKPFLVNVLKRLKKGHWYNIEEIDRFICLDKDNIQEFKLSYYKFTSKEGIRDHINEQYDTVYDIDDTHSIKKYIVMFPVIRAFFFFMASLGIVKIAYDFPKNSLFTMITEQFLTPYDGLRAVSLTDIGAFIIDIDRSYTPKKVRKPLASVNLAEDRLILTISGDDPILQFTIEEMMEKITNNRYRMTFNSFFSHCKTAKDVEHKIKLFKKDISSSLPLVWKEFFKEVKKRIDPIKAQKDMTVFQLSDNPLLFELMTNNPKILSLIYKIEGKMIAVKSSDIRPLIAELKKYGFFFSNG